MGDTVRYFDIPDITFTNSLGKSVIIKDILPVPSPAERTVKLALAENDELDEIATRTNIYGEGYENRGYDLFAENICELVTHDFDMNKLKSLRIPK